MSFDSRLKELREKCELTQDQLGVKVGLSQQTIDHYEKKRTSPRLDTINNLAAVFGVSVDYLIGKTPPGNRHDEVLGEAINLYGRDAQVRHDDRGDERANKSSVQVEAK